MRFAKVTDTPHMELLLEVVVADLVKFDKFFDAWNAGQTNLAEYSITGGNQLIVPAPCDRKRITMHSHSAVAFPFPD